MMDTRDLSAKVVTLLSEIERIGDDFSVEIACEAHFDLACCLQVLGLQVWQGGPGALSLVSHEIGVLIDSRTSWLSAFWPLIFGQVLGFEHFANVVIFARARYFTPEPQ